MYVLERCHMTVQDGDHSSNAKGILKYDNETETTDKIWKTSHGSGGKLTLYLRCPQTFQNITIKNGHDAHWRNLATKSLKYELRI